MVWRTFEVELPLTTMAASMMRMPAPTAAKPNLKLYVVTHVFNNTTSMLWCNGSEMYDKSAIEKLGLAQDLMSAVEAPDSYVSLWSSNHMRMSTVSYWDKGQNTSVHTRWHQHTFKLVTDPGRIEGSARFETHACLDRAMSTNRNVLLEPYVRAVFHVDCEVAGGREVEVYIKGIETRPVYVDCNGEFATTYVQDLVEEGKHIHRHRVDEITDLPDYVSKQRYEDLYGDRYDF